MDTMCSQPRRQRSAASELPGAPPAGMSLAAGWSQATFMVAQPALWVPSKTRATQQVVPGPAPPSVTLTAELSQATTVAARPSLRMRAPAASAPRPTAAMSPSVAPPSGAMRPRW